MRKSCVDKIVCPTCGCEYLPCEIFIGKYLIGNCKNILKDSDGKIESYIGNPLDAKETYICDRCGKLMRVVAKMSFFTENSTKKDFSEEYSVPLNKKKITISEDFEEN
jgi:hypothetical protein